MEDISPFLSNRKVVKHEILGEGAWRIATKHDPKREIVVMMVEHAEAIETPEEHLRANLVTIGLSVVGFDRVCTDDDLGHHPAADRQDIAGIPMQL